MAAMTLTEIRARVREILRLDILTDTSDVGEMGALTQTSNTARINEVGKRIWASVSESAPEQFLEQTTMTYTAATEEVALPSAAQNRQIRVVKALMVAGSTTPSDRLKLQPVTSRDQLEEFADVGDPLAWCLALSSRKIMVRPVPPSDTTLYLLYNPQWTDLVGPTTTPDQLPQDYHPMLAWGAAADFLAEIRDPQAEYWETKFERRLEELRGYMFQTYPASRYTRRRGPDYLRKY